MGLLDFTSKVLTEYKADISDHKAKIKQLTGAQKELAKAELEAAEARNKQLEDQKQGLGRIAIAAGAAFAAIKVGQSGLQEYIKYSDLAAQTNTATLDRLKAASGGLRSEMDLLSFSAKTQHASFKLTTDQQEIALKAMRALSKQGFDSTEVFDKVTQSLVTLQGDGLKEFGIQVDQGKTKAETFANIMKALSGEVAKAGGNLNAQSDDAKRLGVEWDDALSKLKRAIGQIVTALGPLISGIARLVGGIGSLVSTWLDAIDPSSGRISLGSALGLTATDISLRHQDATSLSSGAMAAESAYQSGTRTDAYEIDPRVAGRYAQASLVRWTKITAALKKAKAEAYGEAVGVRSAGGRGYRPGDFSNGFASDGLATPGAFDLGIGSGINVGGTFDTSLGAGILDTYGAPGALQGLINDKGSAMAKDRAAASDARKSKLEAIFGPLSDFNAYAAGFDLLKGSVESAFGAWVDGSKSAAEAAKAFAGSTLKTIAMTLLAESIKNTAYGAAALFNPVTAAEAPGYFAAAAKYAGAAVLVGGLARQLGGGGASGSTTAGAGGGAAPSLVSTSAQSGAPQRPIVQILGDEFAEDSPRRRQQRAARAFEQARRATSDDGGIIYG